MGSHTLGGVRENNTGNYCAVSPLTLWEGERLLEKAIILMMAASSVPDQQLSVEELQVTSAVLMGAAHHYGEHCKKENEAFMDCRIESKDPRKCLNEGREVTQCAMSFFKKVKTSCNEEFTKYWSCLDYNNQDFTKCRGSQAKFDGCMLEKLKIERPKPKEYN